MQQLMDVTPSAPHNMNARGSGTRDISAMDLGSAMPGVTSAGGVLVHFFYLRVPIRSSNAEVNGTYQTRLCVAKQPKADRSTVATRFITEDEARRQFPREFAHFRDNEDQPTQGTPLDELPGITRSQIGILMIHGLRSIEDVVDISDDQASEIGLEATRAKKLAKAWLDRTEANAPTIAAADVEARYQEERRAHEATMKALRDRVAQLEAANGALRDMTGQARGQGQQDGSGKAVAMASNDDLPDDFASMPNPMAEGPDVAEIDEDPLMGN